MSKILFGYSSACCFYDEEDFRAEFKVTDRGTLILRIFEKGGRCEFKQKMPLPGKVVADLKKVLSKYERHIAAFPRGEAASLVLDGSCQQFTLMGKKIYTIKVSKSSVKVLRRIKREFGQAEYEEALQQNELLKIVAELYAILKHYGMHVEDWSPFECDWPPLGEVTEYLNDMTLLMNDLFEKVDKAEKEKPNR
jgi:hypothetical protein